MSRALKIPKLTNPLSRAPKVDSQLEDVFEEMTLAEHLDELRSRIVKVCISVGVAFIAGIFLATPMLRLIKHTADVPSFDMNEVTEGITDFFKTALYIAVAFALPVILYQAFAFISPGLTRKEKRLIFSSLPFAIVLFFMGAAFAFFVAIPKAFQFLSSFHRDLFDFSPTFGSVLSFYMQVTIGMGLAFELPIFMYLLARLGMVGPTRWSKSRRYAAVIVLIAAAVITPTPDPFNMMIVAIPIYIIFEVGIVFARIGFRRHATNSLRDEAAPA
ncbi:MAG: twin-arginine translocase subunit TatC [Thermomicrobiales bacterium]